MKQIRTVEFVPADEAAWVEELHAILHGQDVDGWTFQGSVTREVVREQVGGMAGRASAIQSTALVFAKEG